MEGSSVRPFACLAQALSLGRRRALNVLGAELMRIDLWQDLGRRSHSYQQIIGNANGTAALVENLSRFKCIHNLAECRTST